MERREFLLKSVAGAVAASVAASSLAAEVGEEGGEDHDIVIAGDDGAVYSIPFDKLKGMKAEHYGQSGRVPEAGLQSHYKEVRELLDQGVQHAQIHGEGGQVFCYLINLASLK